MEMSSEAQRLEVPGLVDLIVRSLVDRPDEVSVEVFDEEDGQVLELRVAPDDLGKVIGRQGRIARALRSLLSAAGMKHGCRYFLEILE